MFHILQHPYDLSFDHGINSTGSDNLHKIVASSGDATNPSANEGWGELKALVDRLVQLVPICGWIRSVKGIERSLECDPLHDGPKGMVLDLHVAEDVGEVLLRCGGDLLSETRDL